VVFGLVGDGEGNYGDGLTMAAKWTLAVQRSRRT